MYAPQLEPRPAPIMLRLIGLLDTTLLDALRVIERGLVGRDGATVIVDVRSLDVRSDESMSALAAIVAEARARGRDVRLDARGLHWKRAAKQIVTQPPIDADLRGGVRRTVILAHSPYRLPV